MPPKPVIPPLKFAKQQNIYKSGNPRFHMMRNQSPQKTNRNQRHYRSLLAPLNHNNDLNDPLFLMQEQEVLLKELTVLRNEVNSLQEQIHEFEKYQHDEECLNIKIMKECGMKQDAELKEKIMVYNDKVNRLQNELDNLNKSYTETTPLYSQDQLKGIQFETMYERNLIATEKYRINALRQQILEKRKILENEDLQLAIEEGIANRKKFSKLLHKRSKEIDDGKMLNIKLYTVLNPKKNNDDFNELIQKYRNELEALKAIRIKKQKQLIEKKNDLTVKKSIQELAQFKKEFYSSQNVTNNLNKSLHQPNKSNKPIQTALTKTNTNKVTADPQPFITQQGQNPTNKLVIANSENSDDLFDIDLFDMTKNEKFINEYDEEDSNEFSQRSKNENEILESDSILGKDKDNQIDFDDFLENSPSMNESEYNDESSKSNKPSEDSTHDNELQQSEPQESYSYTENSEDSSSANDYPTVIIENAEENQEFEDDFEDDDVF